MKNLLQEPYASIKILPFDDHGWFRNEVQLTDCFETNEIHTVIEIGSWLGKSTRHIAKSLPPWGKLYAVDSWKGSLNEKVHQEDPRLPILFQQFLSNVIHANLTDKIIPIRMSSEEAAGSLKVMADLIYIDASHDEESVYQDILLWYPHLKEGGILCGDDWSWDSVQKGVIRAAETLEEKIFFLGEFWQFK